MRTFILAALLAIAGAAGAQQTICEPNSCTRKEAGMYLVELAGCHNYLDIYIYDLGGRPVRNVPIDGYAEYLYSDGTILRTEFRQYYSTNSLRAKIPGPGFLDCRLSITIRSDVINVVFDNECDLRAGARKTPAKSRGSKPQATSAHTN